MSINTGTMTLLTVITEAAFEATLVRVLTAQGVRGYSVSEVRGRGSRGYRDGVLAESANIRLEAVCSRAVAESAITLLRQRYYDDFGMVAFMQDVDVLRPEKF